MAVTFEDFDDLKRFEQIERLELSIVQKLLPEPAVDEVFARKLRVGITRGREYLLLREAVAKFQPKNETLAGPDAVEHVLVEAFHAFSDSASEKRLQNCLKVDSRIRSRLISSLAAANDLDAAILGYFALKLLESDPGAEFMREARKKIAELGGPNNAAESTKLLLAVFGQMPFPNISRSTKHKNPAIALISAKKPRCQISPLHGVTELFREKPRKSLQDHLSSRFSGRLFCNFFGKQAVKLAKMRFLNKIDSSNSPDFWDIIALEMLGNAIESQKNTSANPSPKSSPVGTCGLKIFDPDGDDAVDLAYIPQMPAKMPQNDRGRSKNRKNLAQEHNGSWNNSLGETCAGVTRLVEEGVAADNLAVSAALNWILAEQNSDGGWAEQVGISSPEMTALAVLALLEVGMGEHPGTFRGVNFLLEVQKADGNWPSEVNKTSNVDEFARNSLVLAAISRYAANANITNFEVLEGNATIPIRGSARGTRDAERISPNKNANLGPKLVIRREQPCGNSRQFARDEIENKVQLKLVAFPEMPRKNSIPPRKMEKPQLKIFEG